MKVYNPFFFKFIYIGFSIKYCFLHYRDGLRSISQRLERLLRQRREANESAAVAAITADASRTVLDLTAGSSRSVQTSGS